MNSAAALLYDRMTESVWLDCVEPPLFDSAPARPLRTVALSGGRAALAQANRDWGLALSDDEIDYLMAAFARLGRDPPTSSS